GQDGGDIVVGPDDDDGAVAGDLAELEDVLALERGEDLVVVGETEGADGRPEDAGHAVDVDLPVPLLVHDLDVEDGVVVPVRGCVPDEGRVRRGAEPPRPAGEGGVLTRGGAVGEGVDAPASVGGVEVAQVQRV